MISRRVVIDVDTQLDFVWRSLRRLGLSPADADDATQQVFWVAAPVTSSDIFSVGMLTMLTLGALGFVGIKTARDAAFGPATEASSAAE